MNTKYNTLSTWISESRKIAFLTGAGISTSSGIPDFRSHRSTSEDKISIDHYMSRSFLNRHPKLFWKKYKEIFHIDHLKEVKPNKGHNFISEIEQKGKDITVITQNIDGLHQKSGNTKVLETHGNALTATCPKCKKNYGLDYILEETIPRCNNYLSQGNLCGFILHPDVVLYGDIVKDIDKAKVALDEAELFIVIGTSLKVSPINTLPEYFTLINSSILNHSNIKMVIINQESTEKDYLFPIVFHEKIISVVERL